MEGEEKEADAGGDENEVQEGELEDAEQDDTQSSQSLLGLMSGISETVWWRAWSLKE